MNLEELVYSLTEKTKDLPWKRYALTISLGFIGAAALSSYFAAILFKEKINQKKLHSKTTPSFERQNKSPVSDGDITNIIDRNIFNSEGKTPDEDKAQFLKNTDEIIATSLPLKLLGIIYGGSSKTGLAVIYHNTKKTSDSFMEGATVDKQVLLHKIERTRVIFDLGTHKEYLELESMKIERKVSRSKQKSKKPVSQNKFAFGTPPKSFKEDGFERVGSAIVMSKEYRKNMLTKDFTNILKGAKAEPFYEGSDLNGFRLIRVKENSIYQKAGLQNEDIIREINGVQLTDTSQAISLLNSLKNAEDIEVVLSRGGSELTINLQVR